MMKHSRHAWLTWMLIILTVFLQPSGHSKRELTLEEVQEFKSRLEQRLVEVIESGAQYRGPEYVAWAKDALQNFRTKFCAARLEPTLDPEAENEYKIAEFIPALSGEQECFYFIVQEVPRINPGESSVWLPKMGWMVISAANNPDDGYLPYVVFHELFHVPQFQQAQDLKQLWKLPHSTREITSDELEARRAEIALVNDATHGRFASEIERLVKRVGDGDVPSMQGEYVLVTPVSKLIFDLFEGDGIELTEKSRSTILIMVTFAVNHLLLQQRPRDEVSEIQYVFLTYHVSDDLFNPKVKVFLESHSQLR